MATEQADVPELPNGCGYMGRDFGASYIDSECFGGQLYDLDNGEQGVLYEPMEYLPCPQCRHEEWLKGVLGECGDDGYAAHEDGLPRTPPYAKKKLKYPDDLKRMNSAWRRGWDEAKSESGAT